MNDTAKHDTTDKLMCKDLFMIQTLCTFILLSKSDQTWLILVSLVNVYVWSMTWTHAHHLKAGRVTFCRWLIICMLQPLTRELDVGQISLLTSFAILSQFRSRGQDCGRLLNLLQ